MKKAFTLAEVLITLTIIGIVAAITIPSVIANYQQREFKTGLRKAVSVLNEAIQANIATEGETPYEDIDLFDYLTRHMNVIKTERPNARNTVFYTADGMKFEFNENGAPNLVLHESNINIHDNRYQVHLWIHNGYYYIGNNTMCGSYGLAQNKHDTKYAPCVVMVDVNGDKKPSPSHKYFANGTISDTFNVVPKPTDKKMTDIFNILITEDRAIPFGVVAQRAMYEK